MSQGNGGRFNRTGDEDNEGQPKTFSIRSIILEKGATVAPLFYFIVAIYGGVLEYIKLQSYGINFAYYATVSDLVFAPFRNVGILVISIGIFYLCGLMAKKINKGYRSRAIGSFIGLIIGLVFVWFFHGTPSVTKAVYNEYCFAFKRGEKNSIIRGHLISSLGDHVFIADSSIESEHWTIHTIVLKSDNIDIMGRQTIFDANDTNILERMALNGDQYRDCTHANNS
ncbi:hypothetical protein [Limimonas halophila]|nr:hypothetical protein [Limimonas halophila]